MDANCPNATQSPSSSQNSPATPRRAPRRYNFETDMYCVHCAVLIYFQIRDNPSNCFKCKKPLRFRKAGSVTQDQDMGRCDDCDVYLHADDTYCHVCGKGAFKNAQKKRRLEAAAYRQDKFRDGVLFKEKDTKIAKLEEELAKFVKENGEMADTLKSQDDMMMKNHPNKDFGDDSDDEDLFNKAAATMETPSETEAPKDTQTATP